MTDGEFAFWLGALVIGFAGIIGGAIWLAITIWKNGHWDD